jgi:hypothetical protein
VLALAVLSTVLRAFAVDVATRILAVISGLSGRNRELYASGTTSAARK